MRHIRGRVIGVEWLEVVSTGDALRDLPHVRPVEQVAQLGLADQDDLQQLLFRRLEVRQQAHLLE